MKPKETARNDIFSSPLFASALFLAVGTLFGRAFDVSPAILLVAGGLAITIYIKSRFIAPGRICTFFFLLGVSLIWFHDNKPLPENDIHNFISKEKSDVTVKIAATESERHYNTRYLVKVIKVNGSDTTGYARWYAPKNIGFTPLPGDVLHVTGAKIKRPGSYKNIGGFNYERYLKNRDVTAILTTNKRSKISYTETVFSWRRPFEKIKNALKSNLNFEDKTVTAIARSMLIGDQGLVSPEERTAFSRAGSAHLLAVSGLHVGFISATIYFLMKALLFLLFHNTRYEWNSAGVPSRIAAIAAILCVFTFAIITGPRVSSARAAIMATTYLTALFFGRGRDFYGAFSSAIIIILVVSPWSIFEAGFQLSFGAVFAIVVFMERWWKPVFENNNRETFFNPPIGAGILKRLPFLSSCFAMSVFATIGSAPIAAYHFNVIPLHGILLNTFLVPIASFAVPLGLLGSITNAEWIQQVTQIVMRFIWDMTKVTADSPLSHYHLSDIPAYVLAFYYLFIILFLFMDRSAIKKRLTITVAILFLTALSVQPAFSVFNNQLKVRFLDIGQGDCVVITWPKGGAMVIDTGGRYKTFDPGRSIISPVLWREGQTKLTALIVTHADHDHIGGTAGLADLVPPDMLYDHGNIKTKSKSYFRFLERAKTAGKYRALQTGDRVEYKGGLVMEVLSPQPNDISGNQNNNSLVIKLTYGKVSLLFTGDIEADMEQTLLESGVDLSADIIKVAHHGSRSSSSASFLKAVNAKTAVISAGRNNPFGHPAKETLDRLAHAKLKVYRTDIDGEVVMTTDGNVIEWTTYRENVRELMTTQ